MYAMYTDPILAEDWSIGPSDTGAADLSQPPEFLGGSLFGERECDLRDLAEVSEEAADAVAEAGAILQAYLDDKTPQVEA